MADVRCALHDEGVQEHDHALEVSSEASVRRWVDYLGASVGFLCAVHCALTPVALILTPISGVGFLWSEEGEHLMLWSLIALALVSGGASAIRSRNLAVTLGFCASLSLLFISHEVMEGEHDHTLSLGLVLSLLGGVGVTLCHLWSLKLRRGQTCRCSAGA